MLELFIDDIIISSEELLDIPLEPKELFSKVANTNLITKIVFSNPITSIVVT